MSSYPNNGGYDPRYSHAPHAVPPPPHDGAPFLPLPPSSYPPADAYQNYYEAPFPPYDSHHRLPHPVPTPQPSPAPLDPYPGAHPQPTQAMFGLPPTTQAWPQHAPADPYHHQTHISDTYPPQPRREEQRFTEFRDDLARAPTPASANNSSHHGAHLFNNQGAPSPPNSEGKAPESHIVPTPAPEPAAAAPPPPPPPKPKNVRRKSTKADEAPAKATPTPPKEQPQASTSTALSDTATAKTDADAAAATAKRGRSIHSCVPCRKRKLNATPLFTVRSDNDVKDLRDQVLRLQALVDQLTKSADEDAASQHSSAQSNGKRDSMDNGKSAELEDALDMRGADLCTALSQLALNGIMDPDDHWGSTTFGPAGVSGDQFVEEARQFCATFPQRAGVVDGDPFSRPAAHIWVDPPAPKLSLVSTLFGTPPSLQDIVKDMPSEQEAEDVYRYFQKALAFFGWGLHEPTFEDKWEDLKEALERPEAEWNDAVDVGFLATFFALCTAGMSRNLLTRRLTRQFISMGESTATYLGLLSIAVHGAFSISLHRDPSRNKSVSFFDGEDRRRIFWNMFTQCQTISWSDLAFGVKKVSYALVKELDLELRQLHDTLPSAYRIEFDDEEGRVLVNWANMTQLQYRGAMIEVAINACFLRLHRPWLVLAATDDRYAYSRTAAVLSAKRIVAIQCGSTSRNNEANLGGRNYKTLSAAVVLAVELLQGGLDAPGANHLHRLLLLATESCERHGEFSSLCRKGLGVLRFLLTKLEEQGSSSSRGGKRRRMGANSTAVDTNRLAEAFTWDEVPTLETDDLRHKGAIGGFVEGVVGFEGSGAADFASRTYANVPHGGR
ncbi:transcription factor [Pseudohyphozyma bogoriensis]|nr:transcription factor [Pseudohyphozyma bogoriensis]